MKRSSRLVSISQIPKMAQSSLRACAKSTGPEFDPQDRHLHGGKRKRTPESCPLSTTHIPTHTHNQSIIQSIDQSNLKCLIIQFYSMCRVHACNLSTEEAEPGGSGIQSQLGIHNDTVSTFFYSFLGTGEMAPQLKALAALAGDPGSVSSTHTKAYHHP